MLADIPNASADGTTFSAAVDFEDVVEYTCDTGYVVDYQQGLNAAITTLYDSTDTSFKVTCKATGCWSSWPLPYCVRE